MRLISAVDWAELFESVSLVDAMLRDDSDFSEFDFPTRDRIGTRLKSSRDARVIRNLMSYGARLRPRNLRKKRHGAATTHPIDRRAIPVIG
jgi:hypothetical protein